MSIKTKLLRPITRICKLVWGKLFFLQEHRKSLSLVEWHLYKKPDQNISFSVVTAVYNSEKYLDDYFKSLTRQTLDFRKHIRLIMVDDGSTDNSVAIIEKWQKKYPDNIHYIYQENQGAAVARNTGFAQVKSPWVTFIDSDDFVHPHYFYHVTKAIRKHRANNLKMVACRIVSYYEGQRATFKDDRSFRVFFTKPYTLCPANDLKDAMHMTLNSAFFSVKEIRRQRLSFKTKSNWPSFKDAYIILRYLSGCSKGSCLFARWPRYYYRKRSDKTSVIDTARFKPEYFLDQLEEGYIDILRFYYNKLHKVPLFVQRTILYDMSFRIKRIFNNPKTLIILSREEQQKFLRLCDTIFSYIDRKTIMSFSWRFSGFNILYKLGVLHCFKHIDRISPHIKVREYDFRQKLVKLVYYSSNYYAFDFIFYIKNKIVHSAYAKITTLKFMDRVFIYEKSVWLPMQEGDELFCMNAKGKHIPFQLDNTPQLHSLDFTTLGQYFSKKCDAILPKHDAHWILIDRDSKADDNAEHLYRYIAREHPEQTVYFGLRRSSPDWERLHQEGFRLLDYGTPEYTRKLRAADKLISSHRDASIVRYEKGILKNKHFVFLQHGVISADLSRNTNNKKTDLFITASPAEYESIVSNGSPYCLGRKEVALTGLARHDRLFELAQSSGLSQKVLLVMPTWRSYLTGTGKGTDSSLLPGFLESEYAKAWFGLLSSPRFLEIVTKHGFKVQFLSHILMQEYFSNVEREGVIELAPSTDIQSLFVNASILLTDYSSVAFEMAFLRKPVLYYQFDEDDFFSGAHVYTKGYYDYRRDGFGPVVIDENSLLVELEKLLPHGREAQARYLERMERALPVRDGRNCERTYKAILALDTPFESSLPN